MSREKPTKPELIRRFNSLKVEILAAIDEYVPFHSEAHNLKSKYDQRIVKSFATAAVKNTVITDRQAYKEFYDVEAMERLSSYSWYSAFTVLRQYSRKLRQLSKNLYARKAPLLDFIPRVKELDRAMTSQNFDERYPDIYDELLKLRDIILRYKQEKFLDMSFFYPLLEYPFLSGWNMDKRNFLQIITIDKGKRHWDGVPVQPFAQRFQEMPEEIGFEEFKSLIFLHRLEHDRDCYIFDIFMGHMLKTMDQYKKETGVSGIDIFQEIAGKPLQTFTAHMDEYGDIVSTELNKPNLKLIHGGTVGC